MHMQQLMNHFVRLMQQSISLAPRLSPHTTFNRFFILQVTERWVGPGNESIVILTLDGDDQLGYNREYLWSPVLQHVVYTLPGKELVGMASFTESIKEERKIVVVVQLLYFHLDGGKEERVTVGEASEEECYIAKVVINIEYTLSSVM